MRHGKGKKILDDGTIYEGEWANGLPEGNGLCIYPDGS